VSSNPVHGEVYSIQHYVVKFVSVGSFLRELRSPPPNKNWPPRYKWNIIESGAKHLIPPPIRLQRTWLCKISKTILCSSKAYLTLNWKFNLKNVYETVTIFRVYTAQQLSTVFFEHMLTKGRYLVLIVLFFYHRIVYFLLLYMSSNHLLYCLCPLRAPDWSNKLVFFYSWISWSHQFECFTVATMTCLTVTEYLCRKCFVRRNHNPVLFAFVTVYWVCNQSNTTTATCGAGSPSGAVEFTAGF